jgi:hypothetical protein
LEFNAPDRLQPSTKAATSKTEATAPLPFIDIRFVLLLQSDLFNVIRNHDARGAASGITRPNGIVV